MPTTERLQAVHQAVRTVTEWDPVTDPFAVPAAMACVYAAGDVSPAEAYAYLGLLAKVAERRSEELDAADILVRLCVLLGSSLANLGREVVADYIDPHLEGLPYRLIEELQEEVDKL